ncbi:MAG TPA: D-aminoacyl-tRNA deacylase [Anaerolineales bacterium]|nr:D-aminoacyl-tRNA deacylase [Anaerolineales bacterium]
MRVLIQRVSKGSVTITGQRVSEIGRGLVILVGVGRGDTPDQAEWLAEKTANLRIFEDDEGKMNRSVLESGGSALVVSQFTLYANVEKGRRPSFIEAAPPEDAEPLVTHFAHHLKALGVPIQTGVFRAVMLVEIHNDGPVTIWLEK